MSHHPAHEPVCSEVQGHIDVVIEPKAKDLGGFTVRRVLPSLARRMVGPFVFFDHMGPAEFAPGEGIQVRPHPHIGLATVTYLFEGEILHRDSLGIVQPIQAGAVNLMTAGRGIVHSERAGADLDTVSTLHGIQSWMALPTDQEMCAPAFIHHPASTLPDFEENGVRIRVILGEAYGHRSPVEVRSPTLYLECRMARGQTLTLPKGYEEVAFYVVSGTISADGHKLSDGIMAVASAEDALRIEATEDSHLMVIGGTSLGPRRMWWNFVATSKARIEQAKADWREKRFAMVPGETEFIPLPD